MQELVVTVVHRGEDGVGAVVGQVGASVREVIVIGSIIPSIVATMPSIGTIMPSISSVMAYLMLPMVSAM